MPDDVKDGSRSGVLKLDGGGLPLIPQPTNSPTDPLNYPNVFVFFVRHNMIYSLKI